MESLKTLKKQSGETYLMLYKKRKISEEDYKNIIGYKAQRKIKENKKPPKKYLRNKAD